MRLLWTVPALDDLKEISSFIEKDRGVRIADGVCSEIYESAQMLARHRKHGKLAGTRELGAGKYIIGYCLASESVEIVRIWHGARRNPPF